MIAETASQCPQLHFDWQGAGGAVEEVADHPVFERSNQYERVAPLVGAVIVQ
jgi:hypothetical protein